MHRNPNRSCQRQSSTCPPGHRSLPHSHTPFRPTPPPQELSNDKAAAEAELNAKLGTLRYLTGIKDREAARAAAQAAAQAAEAHAAEAAGQGPEAGSTAAAGEAAAAVGSAAAGVAGPGCRPGAAAVDDADICPVCHDELGQELVRAACVHAVAATALLLPQLSGC